MNLVLNSVMASAAGMAYAMSSAESLSILIEEFAGIDIVKKGTYAKLHDSIARAGTVESAELMLDEGEKLFIEREFSAAQIAAETTKGGKIKKSKFLPGDYQSAKSVLLGALRQGIPLFDENGEALGKSALSKAQSEGSKTASEKIAAQLESILKIIRKESPEVQAELIAAVSATVDGWIPATATATVAIAE